MDDKFFEKFSNVQKNNILMNNLPVLVDCSLVLEGRSSNILMKYVL
jgi:hypothetical protein